MIISVNWLKKFTQIDLPIDELATLIGARLVEVEQVIDLGAKYRDAIIARVVEVNKLEGSDHLNIAKINDGGVTADIERDENNLIQVVCGAPNIRADQMVVWLPPGATVPETFGDEQPFVLGVRKLRGITSNGMIASAKELDLFDEHEGILEVDSEIAAGTMLATAYELDDYLLDIENKSLTHRPDCFGIIGFAREVAAIQGKKFNTPEWLKRVNSGFNSIQPVEAELNVVIDDPKLSDRYQAVVLSGADGAAKSPLKTQLYLARVGIRPINAIVDVTNYLMMLTGQPLHAFDYDKVVALAGGRANIRVRAGHENEELVLLDGRAIRLTSGDIVIAAGDTAIGLAGAMGGLNTVIDDTTKRIIVESATFNLYNLRSTQMRHGIFSEAITRFTKGQPASLTEPVIVDAINLMHNWAGAECNSQIAESYPGRQNQKTICVKSTELNAILGSDLSNQAIISTLNNAEFTVCADGDVLTVTPPFWRTDINIIQDIAEEVGRLSGFDNINPTLPMRSFEAIAPVDFDNFRNRLRQTLTRAGANEVLTYNFIHGDIITKANQAVENSYRITNSISPDLQYYRQTLTPSLLNLVHTNIKQGYDSFALYELNKTHKKSDGLNDERVPIESDMVAMVFASKSEMSGAPYYRAQHTLEYLCRNIGVEVVYQPLSADDGVNPLFAAYEPRRSAKVLDKSRKMCIGVVGEYQKPVGRKFKLPDYSAGFELDVRALHLASDLLKNNYKSISRYPASERDICLRVAADMPYFDIQSQIEQSLVNIQMDSAVSLLDIYQGPDSDTKNITFRIRLNAGDHTLNGAEVTAIIDDLVRAVTGNIAAALV